MNHLIAPSVLSANFKNLQGDIDMLNRSLADWVHVDVMDGVFVPNISFGMPIIKQIHEISEKPLDVHLMIVQPERYLKDFQQAGAAILTVHWEACTHLHRTIQEIKSLGMKAGVSLNPHTPVALLHDIISELDMVLIMSVNPGFGGQKFIPQSLNKIRQLKSMIMKSGNNCLIEVDGGVNGENAIEIIKAGADVLVAGNYVFKSADPIQTIRSLKNLTPFDE